MGQQRQVDGFQTKEVAEHMEPSTRPAPHDKTRFQVDLRFPIPDPRRPSKKLRLQKTAPKGLSEDGAKEWAHKNAERFLAEFFGEQKEEPTQKTITRKPVNEPVRKRAPKVSEVYLDMLGAVIEAQEPGTQTTWASIWRCHLEPQWGDLPVDLITRLDILRWRKDLQKRYAPTTCNEIITKLQGLLSHAAELGHIAGRPKIQKLPVDEAAEKDAYSEEELDRLFEAASGDEVATLVLLLTLDAGLRRNELIALRWCDVDFKGSTVRIKHTMYGKRLKCPKGKKAVDIPMTPRLQEALMAAKKDRRLTDHVFQGIRNPWTSESDLRRHMIDVATRANVEWKGFHKGKHTFISTLLDEEAPLQELQHLARHKHPTTTERYMHTRKVAAVMRSGISRLAAAQEGRGWQGGVKKVLKVVK